MSWWPELGAHRLAKNSIHSFKPLPPALATCDADILECARRDSAVENLSDGKARRAGSRRRLRPSMLADLHDGNVYKGPFINCVMRD